MAGSRQKAAGSGGAAGAAGQQEGAAASCLCAPAHAAGLHRGPSRGRAPCCCCRRCRCRASGGAAGAPAGSSPCTTSTFGMRASASAACSEAAPSGTAQVGPGGAARRHQLPQRACRPARGNLPRPACPQAHARLHKPPNRPLLAASHLGRHADCIMQVAANVEQQGVEVQHPTRLARHDAERRQVDAAAAACRRANARRQSWFEGDGRGRSSSKGAVQQQGAASSAGAAAECQQQAPAPSAQQQQKRTRGPRVHAAFQRPRQLPRQLIAAPPLRSKQVAQAGRHSTRCSAVLTADRRQNNDTFS